jgi:hypothetical protein
LLTIRQVKIAESNGISYKTLKSRHAQHWPEERMLYEPTRERFHEWHQYKDVCKANRISYRLYWQRIKEHDMDPLKAATMPVVKSHSERNRKHPKKYLELAESNGISRKKFYDRLKLGMDYHTAATKPWIKGKSEKMELRKGMVK